jgi:hypothetical protein
MKKLAILGVALLVAFGASACGGDDDDDAAPSDESAEDAGDDEAAGDDDSDVEEESGDDEGDDDSETPSGDSDSEFCQLARQYTEQFADDASDDFTEEEFDAYEHLRSVAPDELVEPMENTLDFLRELQEAGDDPDAQAEVFENSEELTAEFEAIDSYFTDVCGIDQSAS